MHAVHTPWWAWFLGILLSTPWLALSVWLWRQTPKDERDTVLPSMGETLRRRLLDNR
jgi:protein-S-isoprenylcysteine O-methyltransferase Ste14